MNREVRREGAIVKRRREVGSRPVERREREVERDRRGARVRETKEEEVKLLAVSDFDIFTL